MCQNRWTWVFTLHYSVLQWIQHPLHRVAWKIFRIYTNYSEFRTLSEYSEFKYVWDKQPQCCHCDITFCMCRFVVSYLVRFLQGTQKTKWVNCSGSFHCDLETIRLYRIRALFGLAFLLKKKRFNLCWLGLHSYNACFSSGHTMLCINQDTSTRSKL